MSRMPAASPSEGTFGVAFDRLMPEEESITSRPACTLASAWCTGMNTALVCPPRMPVIMPSDPLYGMCVRLMPARCLKSSIAR